MIMKQMLILFAFAIALMGTAAEAACYADYKAKQDNPLRLHYGVVQINGACDVGTARAELSARIRGSGWTLLNVISVFGPEGLAERKASAGPFFLAF